MRKAVLVTLAVIGLGAGPAQAVEPPVAFEDAVYLTCREVDEMDKGKRVAIVRYLAEHAGNRHGIRFRDEDKLDRELAGMIRAGCTMFPNATVFFIVSSAVKAEAEKLRAAPPAR